MLLSPTNYWLYVSNRDSYKLGKNLSALAEIEYHNFTVHGKSKETKVYTENGVDKLNMSTNFRQLHMQLFIRIM
jgi:hypothetical protein